MKYFKLLIKLFLYGYNRLTLFGTKYDFKIMSLYDTLNNILEKKCSVIRFGDGEFIYMSGNQMPGKFQEQNDFLRNKLIDIISLQDERLLVCLPEPICDLSNIRFSSKMYWTSVNARLQSYYHKWLPQYQYGNSFISRPYMVYKDKSNSESYFSLLKQIWSSKNVVMIEGDLSRTGVGNDLFDNASSISRVICPSTDAFKCYDKIFQASKRVCKELDNLIVLVALGPTAKPLTYDLTLEGYQVIDIGHIDSEYEWFLKGAREKILINGKHTAERDNAIVDECYDDAYLDSIVCKVLSD